MDYNIYKTTSVILVIMATTFCATEIPYDICSTDIHLPSNVTCVRLSSCPYGLKLIDNKDLVTLAKIKCGFEGRHPKICCPKGEVPILYNVSEEIATNRPKPKPLSTLKPVVTSTSAPNIMEQTDTFPNKTICGKSGGVGNRIVGGTITGIHEHPWLARMQYKIDDADRFGCSAVLITDRYLLTAAHCVIKYIPVAIRLGDWNTKTKKDCYKDICNEETIDVNISKIIKHPTSKILKTAVAAPSVEGDIALIQLEAAVTFTDYIQPICLPKSQYIETQDYSRDSVYVAAGWGQTEFESESDVKRQVLLKAAPIEVCRNIFNLKPESEANIICAGGVKGKDTCKGDSGGPLIKLLAENYEINWYLFGITSLGVSQCGSEGVPSIYTRVSSYMDWIKTVVGK